MKVEEIRIPEIVKSVTERYIMGVDPITENPILFWLEILSPDTTIMEQQIRKLEKLPTLPTKSRTLGGGFKYDYSNVAPFHAVLVRHTSDTIRSWFSRSFNFDYTILEPMTVFVYWMEQNIYTSYTIEEFKDKFGIEPLKESAFEEILQQNNFFVTGNTGTGSTGEKCLSGIAGPIEEKAVEKNETPLMGCPGVASHEKDFKVTENPNTWYITRACSEGRMYEKIFNISSSKEKFLPTLDQLKSTGFAVIANKEDSPSHKWFNAERTRTNTKTPFKWYQEGVYFYSSRGNLRFYNDIDTFLCAKKPDAYILTDDDFSTVLAREANLEEPLPTLESLEESGFAVIAKTHNSPSHEWFNEKCNLNDDGFYEWLPGYVYVCYPDGRLFSYTNEEVYRSKCSLPILSDEEFTRVLKNSEPKGFYTGLPSSLHKPFAIVASKAPGSFSHEWMQNYSVLPLEWRKGITYIFRDGEILIYADCKLTAPYSGPAMPLCTEDMFEAYMNLKEREVSPEPMDSKINSLREATPKQLKELMDDIEFLAKNTDNTKFIKNYGLAYDKILEARGWLLQNKYNEL